MDTRYLLQQRARSMSSKKLSDGPIVYWMCRDQRVHDNWALLYAIDLAMQRGEEPLVLFCLRPSFDHSTRRLIDFLIKGLQDVEKHLSTKHIRFFFKIGKPEEEVPRFLKTHKAGACVTDFFPLSWKRSWDDAISSSIYIPFYQVDAHNVVPAWVVSPKLEYSAATFRPKIHRLLPQYLTGFPPVPEFSFTSHLSHSIDWDEVRSCIHADDTVSPVTWLQPGEDAAHDHLDTYIQHRLHMYGKRNDPNTDAQSHLSPYLHFGHISAQRVALRISDAHVPEHIKESFLEELIVRKELSDNFCLYQPKYDTVQAFPVWAQKTLHRHLHDTRQYLYTTEQLSSAATHDPLWNAAQHQMIKKGSMHGYMRMYWAKKILEWSKTPEEAQKHAIYLNDRYFLDGRDPNGYTGIAWSMGGLHDRPWVERPIFGQIRYMNARGAARKFDVDQFVRENS